MTTTLAALPHCILIVIFIFEFFLIVNIRIFIVDFISLRHLGKLLVTAIANPKTTHTHSLLTTNLLAHFGNPFSG
jgi:hypothetical protein